jgi:hypothetical protein
VSQELLYTSAPQGLKPGSRGFCTVLSTRGMSAPLATALEGLSGYRPVFPSSDERVELNPVVWSHLKLPVAGRTSHILSRIADSGLDYSQRANKLAHHVVLDPGELIPGGPAQLIALPGFMRTSWKEEPQFAAPKPVRKVPPPQPGLCHAWKEITGDAGWAGVLGESFLKDPDRPVYLLFEPGYELLPLIAESISLLPPDRRWDVTFNTYSTGQSQAGACAWRGLLKDSPEARQSLRFPNALRIDLTAKSWDEAQGGKLVEAARGAGRAKFTSTGDSTGASTGKSSITRDDAVETAGSEEVETGVDARDTAESSRTSPRSTEVYSKQASWVIPERGVRSRGGKSNSRPQDRDDHNGGSFIGRERWRILLGIVCVAFVLAGIGIVSFFSGESYESDAIPPKKDERDVASTTHKETGAKKVSKSGSIGAPGSKTTDKKEPGTNTSEKKSREKPSKEHASELKKRESEPAPPPVGDPSQGVAGQIDMKTPPQVPETKAQVPPPPLKVPGLWTESTDSNGEKRIRTVISKLPMGMVQFESLCRADPDAELTWTASLWGGNLQLQCVEVRKGGNDGRTYKISEENGIGKLATLTYHPGQLKSPDEFRLISDGNKKKLGRLNWCKLDIQGNPNGPINRVSFFPFPVTIDPAETRFSPVDQKSISAQIAWVIPINVDVDKLPEFQMDEVQIKVGGKSYAFSRIGEKDPMSQTDNSNTMECKTLQAELQKMIQEIGLSGKLMQKMPELQMSSSLNGSGSKSNHEVKLTLRIECDSRLLGLLEKKYADMCTRLSVVVSSNNDLNLLVQAREYKQSKKKAKSVAEKVRLEIQVLETWKDVVSDSQRTDKSKQSLSAEISQSLVKMNHFARLAEEIDKLQLDLGTCHVKSARIYYQLKKAGSKELMDVDVIRIPSTSE